MTLRRLLLAFVCLSFAACATAAKESGTGGTTGNGGTSPSTGGSTGTGGTSPSTGGTTGTGGAGAGLGTGVGYAFPQNMKTGMCTLTTVSNAATDTMSAYASWKSTYVVSASPGLRVQRPENGNDTVSEGIGYGMLAAVYMGDKPLLDGLFAYAQSHFDSKGLMSWCIPNGSNSCSGSGSATDGDEDMIFALLMASDQFSGTDYLTPARAMIQAMRTNSLFSDGTLENGDNFNTADELNPDYFSPAYFPVFTKASGDKFWTEFALAANYKHLMALTGTDGLVPDSSDLENNTTCSTCKATYGYDACRTPWRIAMDYCWNNSANAQAYLQKIGAFFSGVGAANIGDGYSMTGSQTSGNHNLAFIGPAGVAGMAGFQTLEDASFNLMVNPPSGNTAYFPQSIRVLSMLMMTGNFLDYSQL